MQHPIDRAIKSGFNPIRPWIDGTITEEQVNMLDDLNDPIPLLEYFHISMIHDGTESVADSVKSLIIAVHDDEIEDLDLISY